MKTTHYSETCVKILLMLVVTWRSGVRGELCPPGEVTHHEEGRTMCCLPVDCDPHYYLKYCEQNGTADRCERCPRKYALFKRTSSFAMEPCQVFSLVPKTCEPLPGNPRATEDDKKNCYCDLEKGEHYMRPQVPLGPTSFCQLHRRPCSKGEQPNQDGDCEPCPKNTVQDRDNTFVLCRPQRNCSAMRLATEEMGNSQKETVCAKPPALPTRSPPVHEKPTTTTVVPVEKTSTKTTSVVVVDGNVASVAPVLEGSDGEGGLSIIHIILVSVGCLVALLMLILLLLVARRRGWCAKGAACHRRGDAENRPYPVNQLQMSNHDNDNVSDDSCCACADSCLASSSSGKGSCGGSGKAGGGQCKTPGGPVPMLEAYMNGKCPHMTSENSSLSEAIYNSISHDESKLGEGNLASYKNVNGVPPTPLRQPDFYNYPSKVRLPSMEDEDDNNSLKKAPEGGVPPMVVKGKDREDFSETDPLLPNSENVSSGTPTPVAVPAPRGILRNGNSHLDPQGRGRVDGGGGGDGFGGNRPNLSMLLSSVDGSSHGGSVGVPAPNVPYLSQLMSSPYSGQGSGQHQKPQQQPAPEPPQHVHELPPQLQQHLLQQQLLQKQQLQQQQQEGSTLPLRLVPASSAPPVDRSLVQMDELKPVMPLNPSPSSPAPPPPPPPAPTGAANVVDSRIRTGSPARISPSQQKEVKSGNGREAVNHGKTTKPVKEEAPVPKKPEKVDDETFRKQALPAVSPEEDEETARKSVGGSSGLGDSLDISSPLSMPSDEGRRSRTLYRRSNSEASRSVSPPLPLPPSRSISSPEDKHRPYAVVKPMQSDQSLNAMSSSQDRLTELTQPLDAAGRHFPLHSLRPHTPRRQSSQDSADDPDLTRPKTPDCLSEEENEENDSESNNATQESGNERTRAHFYGDNDGDGREDREGGLDSSDKPVNDGNEG